MRRSAWIRAGIWSGGAFLVLLAAAAIGFQDNLFRHAMDPRAPFQTLPQPALPDYASPEAWAARPEAPREGVPAIFFVHPTTYWGGDAWNAGPEHLAAERRLEESALPTYAGAFKPLGDLWAPRYRQASLYASLTHRLDARLARQLAYGDVKRAFDRFLAEAPPEAPIIMVGVEQGGLHVLGLLQDALLFSEPLRARLVAAYVIDQATPLDLFDGGLAHIEPCRTPRQTGCVASWGAVEEDDVEQINDFRSRSMVWMGDGRLEPTEGRALLCVNPLTGATAEDYIPARNNHGAVDATGLALGIEPAPLPNQTSAQCSDGVLLVDRPQSSVLRQHWRWGGRFMPAQAFLFYADVRRDAERRLDALAAGPVESQVEAAMTPPPENLLPPLETVEIVPSPIHKVQD